MTVGSFKKFVCYFNCQEVDAKSACVGNENSTLVPTGAILLFKIRG